MRNGINHHQKVFAVCLFVSLVFAGGGRVFAGPLPMPLEVHLDLATHVVMGEVTQMQESDVQRGSGVRWGSATVTVRETLKGQAAKTLTFLVASWVDPNYGGSSPVRVRKKGDSGIWLIKPGGTVSRTCGLLAENRRDDVQRILKSLEEREWSAQTNGLKAWAGVVQPRYGHHNPVIIFAVKNSSDADIHYPVASQPGVVAAVAESPDKMAFKYPAAQRLHSKTVFCRKISPGETVYLHPDYSFIDLAWRLKLLPGNYRVSVTYQNDSDGEAAASPGRRERVEAWKGRIEAPTVELVLPLPKREGSAQPTASTDSVLSRGKPRCIARDLAAGPLPSPACACSRRRRR